MESCVFWISRVLVWRLVPPCSRVLWRDHINPRILEVLWEKNPSWYKINMESIKILWFCRNWWTLG